MREAERESRRRLHQHPEIDGEGIQLALEHEWALMALRAAPARALAETMGVVVVGHGKAAEPATSIVSVCRPV